MFETFGLEDVIESFDRSRAWMQTLGVKTSGRLDGYSRILHERLTQKNRNPDGDDDYLLALYEAMDVSQFGSLPPELVDDVAKNKLRAIANGAESYVNTKDDAARNYAFEFITAAWMHRWHRLIALDVPTDVVSALGPMHLHTECKRPQGEPSFARLIGEAMSKVRKSGEGSPLAYGLAAIDISRLVNPDLSPIRGESIPEIETEIDLRVSKLLDRNSQSFAKLRRTANLGERFLSTMMRIAVPAILEPNKNFLWFGVWRATEPDTSSPMRPMARLFLGCMGATAHGPIEYRGNTIVRDGVITSG